MIVSHRATASLETRLRHLYDRDTCQAWTLAEIDKVMRSGCNIGAARVEVQSLMDGCNRRMAELGALHAREMEAIDGKTYPDESNEPD